MSSAFTGLASGMDDLGDGDSSERIVAELHIVTLDDFVAVEEPGAAAILGLADSALIPEGGDVMVYGDGGVGKTTLTVDLALHLAAGDDWLGIAVARAVRVLIIENEGPRPLFRRKLRRKRQSWCGSPLGDRLLIFERPWGQFSFTDELWRRRLADEVRAREVDVVVVGPLTSSGMDVAGTLQEARDFAAHVEQVRALSGRSIAIVLVHHENKGGKVSGAWEGVGDTLLHVQQQGHGRLRLYIQKARWASEQHATTLRLIWAAGDGFALDEEEQPRPERVWDDIAEFVLAHGGCGWNDVDSHVSGQGDYKRRRRDEMLAGGVLVNARTSARMELWHRDDPARPTLHAEIASEQGRGRDAVSVRPGGRAAEGDRVPASRRSRDAVGDAVVRTSPAEPREGTRARE